MWKWLADTIAKYNAEKAWDLFKDWFVITSGAATMLTGILQQVPISAVIVLTLMAAAAALHIRNQLGVGSFGAAPNAIPAAPPKVQPEPWASVGPYGGRFKRIMTGNIEEIVVEITAKRPMRNVKVSLDVWQYTPNISGHGKSKVDRIDLSNTGGRNFDLHRDETSKRRHDKAPAMDRRGFLRWGWGEWDAGLSLPIRSRRFW